LPDEAVPIRPDASPVAAADEITTYAEADRWHPSAEPPG
jgi:hypothetical protein